jgi:hypothetical protein
MSPNMFGRPDDPINEDPTEISSPNAPNVNVAYPTFNDWLGLYNFDNTLTRGEAWNRSLFADMKGSYERAVLALLNLIAKSSVGRAVLTEIMLGPLFEVRILPYDFQSGQWSVGTGAVTRAWNEKASWLKDVPLAGQSARGKPYVSTSATTGQPIVGTGAGSSADIFFTASRHKGKNEAEETLLHELLHASRKVRGVTYRMPVSGGYGNIEEFLAVTVSNMYRSQKKEPLEDYHGYEIKPSTFLDSNLSPTPRLLLGYMRNKQKSLFERLAALDDAPFNPMKQVRDTSDALIRKIEHA